MKKMIVLLTLTLSLMLTGCGGKEKQNTAPTSVPKDSTAVEPTSEATEQVDQDNATESTDGHSYQKFDDLPGTLSVNLSTEQYSIDTVSYAIQRSGSGWMVSKDGVYTVYDQFVSLASDNEFGVNPELIRTPDQILDAMSKQFMITATVDLQATGVLDYIITNQTNVTVNGWDMCRYEGYFETKPSTIKDNQAHFVAYSVIKDDHPVYFVVVDNTDEQDQGALINEQADKIAKTFREYEE